MSEQKDVYGVHFSTQNNQPPTAGQRIIINSADGSKSEGFWQGQALK